MKADWFAVDWGASGLKVWAMRSQNVLAEATSERGASGLAPEEFEPLLLDLIGDWIPEKPFDVVACGMAAGRNGWTESPFTAVPAEPLAKGVVSFKGNHPDLTVHVVPGMKQASPADVMQGQETRVAGFLASNEHWDGVICLPGTQTTWAHVSANEVVSFQTFMTGELMDLLCGSSLLRHSVGEGWDREVFHTAMDETLSRPESLAAKLFGIRAMDLLTGQEASVARSRLSGFLIGAELAAARPYWLGQQIAVIGADARQGMYRQALERQGALATTHDAEEMTLAGLIAARKLAGAGG